MSKQCIYIFGTSGFAKEVRDLSVACGFEVSGYLNRFYGGAKYDGLRVLPDSKETISKLKDQGAVFAFGVGRPSLRKEIANRVEGINLPNLIHPQSSIGRAEVIGDDDRGIIVCAGVRLTCNITLGRRVVLNLNATVGHDTILGDDVSVMPGSNISGNVLLNNGVYLGTGSCVINGNEDKKLIIGKHTIVGAGAVVTRDLPSNVTAVGIPAKPLQQ